MLPDGLSTSRSSADRRCLRPVNSRKAARAFVRTAFLRQNGKSGRFATPLAFDACGEASEDAEMLQRVHDAIMVHIVGHIVGHALGRFGRVAHGHADARVFQHVHVVAAVADQP